MSKNNLTLSNNPEIFLYVEASDMIEFLVRGDFLV